MYYAGIGSRETPPDILLQMRRIAREAAGLGLVLRSGGAKGADRAFEIGAVEAGGETDIYYPHSHQIPSWAYMNAQKHHPNWAACTEFARSAHARNSLIVYGRNALPEELVRFIVCWTPNGLITGGTGQALRIARHEHIPVWNLAVQKDLSLTDFVPTTTE